MRSFLGSMALMTVPLALSVVPSGMHGQVRVTTGSSLTVAGASTQAADLQATVSLRLENATLEEALRTVARQADLKVALAEPVLSVTRRVTLTVQDVSAERAFRSILAGTDVTMTVSPSGQIMFTRPAANKSIQGAITGKVISAKTQRPVSGVTILVDQQSTGVVTGEDGTFRITAPPGEHVLSIRGIGFVRQTKRITISQDQALTLTIALEPSASVLDEVIVTGTVVATERKAIPTPITVITAADIEKRGITRIDELFRGEVPGVVALDVGVSRYDGQAWGAMASSQVYARGSSTLTGGANPLKTYIDGVELLDPMYLGTIDPKSIERVEIITGPQAATIYGSGALGGVMQIFTKKGGGSRTPDVTLNLKYGMLQSTLTSGLTPTHNDALTLTGGNGPSFSYTGTFSYNYSGQWMPKLFDRTYGAQGGVTIQQGPLTASGSVSLTSGMNGTAYSNNTPYMKARQTTGDVSLNSAWFAEFSTRSTSFAQTTGLNIDYKATPYWQHHVTLGNSQNSFDLIPGYPMYLSPWDTLRMHQGMSGRRVSMDYNTTLTPSSVGPLSFSVVVGATGSSAKSTSYRGGTASTVENSWANTTVSQSIGDDSYGGFSSVRLGLADQFFVTGSVRAEHNPAFGSDHAIDWTPTVGATYTLEYRNLTVKTLMSYGRATRPPNPFYKESYTALWADYEPAQWLAQFANPELKPEYERGPQGGIEIYYGNIGSLAINHYQQKVTDLILRLPIDSIPYTYLPDGSTGYFVQSRYDNAAKMRQKGWEGVGTLNVGPLSFKGTYSWTDSRIVSMSPKYQQSYVISCSPLGDCLSSNYQLNSPFRGVPTHSGSGSVSYAMGRTSVMLVANWIGSMVRIGEFNPVIYGQVNARLRMYTDYYRQVDAEFTQPGYVKTDLAATHRIVSWATATLNVKNLGDRSDGDRSYIYPTLGRQTQLGMSLRFPRR